MAPERAIGVVPGVIPVQGGALAGIPGVEALVEARGASGRGRRSSIRSGTVGATPSTWAQPTIPDDARPNTARAANSVTGTGWSSRPRPYPESPPKASSGANLPRSARGTDVTPDTTPQAMAGSTGDSRSKCELDLPLDRRFRRIPLRHSPTPPPDIVNYLTVN